MFVILLITIDSVVIDGDVESDSGLTSHTEKVRQGLFYQGDKRFGTTSGAECVCNSLYALSWS